MTCSKCGKSLSGGADTFGPFDTPLCLFCYYESLAKPKEPPVTYGIKITDDGEVLHTIKFNRDDGEQGQ